MKKAAKKAPAKKAAAQKAAAQKKAPAKKVAAKKVAAPAAPLAEGAAPAAKKAPAKRAAKKAAASAPSAATDPQVESAAVGPAKRSRSRSAAAAGSSEEGGTRSARFAAGSPSDTPAVAAASEPVAVPVLFVPPSEAPAVAPVARTPRKRAARAATSGGTDDAAVEPAVVAQPTGHADADADGDGDSDEGGDGQRRRRRRGRRGRGGRASDGAEPGADESAAALPSGSDESDDSASGDGDETGDDADEIGSDGESTSSRRRRRRRRKTGTGEGGEPTEDDPPNTTVHVRERRSAVGANDGGSNDEVKGIRGSVRLEAKRQRRKEGRDSNRRRRAPILTEAEFLARRESVDRTMAVRQRDDLTQIAILEDDVLVEHHVTRASTASSVGNVYLGRVQNVLPGMEAAFVDIGRGRNGVLYAGEVNWDAAGLEGRARSIEAALKAGDSLLVQVTKDPIGHKGARLTSQISLPGRFLVYVPGGGMTGISRKLPDTERSRLKAILKKIVPEGAGVIVRTAAEGASEEDLTHDVERLKAEWESIQATAAKGSAAPTLVHGEPDLAIRVVRDVFNEDFKSMVVDGDRAWDLINEYVDGVAPELADRVHRYTGNGDLFHDLRVDEQLAKALDRKVWLPSGGSLVIDRTEAMTVIDVNTGKFTGSGGNLESTVTKNNLEAAEEIVRQLRLRDLGGIIVIDFIDMVLESNRELVLRRLTECLGRDRTKHQVAEVTSLGLVQMTRKRVGEGLLEAFSEPCEHCHGRGVIVHTDPVIKRNGGNSGADERPRRDQPKNSEQPKKQRKTKAERAEEERLAAEAAELRAKAASAINLIAAKTLQHGDSPAEPGEVAELAAAVTAELAEPPATTEEAQPAGATAKVTAVASEQPAAVAEPEPGPAAPVRPRRRRAASRPAGPPQHASEPNGAAHNRVAPNRAADERESSSASA